MLNSSIIKTNLSKNITLINLLILFFIGISITYACIGQDGSVSEIRSYPTPLSALPSEPTRVGENTLVILVDFSGCAGTTTQAQWNNILLTDHTPDSSMKDYYLEATNNIENLVGAQENSGTTNNGVVGWYTMPFNHPYNTYGATWQSRTGESLPGMPWMNPSCRTWALSKQLAYLACKKADSNVNYTQFTHTHYGSGTTVVGQVFAHAIIIVAGYEGTYSGAGTPYTKRHHWYMPGDGYQSNDLCSCWPLSGYMCIGGSNIGYGYILVGEKTPTGGIIGQGLVAHEVGHDFGLPDLYDVDGSTNGYGNGLGSWCLMAGGDWSGTPYATKPGHFSAWCKLDRGWATPTIVQNTKLLNTQIPAVESVPTIYKLIPYNRPNCRQYFLVENRQQKKFDASLPGSGLLIYHVDDSIIALNRWPNLVNTRVGYTDALHYGVDVECQDGYPLGSIDHLDSYASGNWGDVNDPWVSTPDFDTNSTPNSSVYYGSKSLVKSYVAVRNISASGSPMTADLVTIPPGAVFSVLPTNINFGNVAVSSSKTDSVTVTNNGDATLNISSIVSNNLRFSVNPTNANINPTESKKFYITFSPTSAGSQSGNIIFTHNAATSPDTVTVSGTGTSVTSGWASLESLPTNVPGKYVKDGGAMVIVPVETKGVEPCPWVFRGNKSNEFYRCDTTSTWVLMESIPFGVKPPPDTLRINKKKIGKGAALCYDGDSIIYATRGNSTKEFWAYNILYNRWTQKAFVPVRKALKGGTSIAWLNGKVYLLAGGQKIADPTNFYIYNPDDDTIRFGVDPSPFRQLTKATEYEGKPYKDGSCIVVLGEDIYALQGGGKHNYFSVYDTALNRWAQLETIPLAYPTSMIERPKKNKVKDGGSMCCDSFEIYAVKGGGKQDFWKYTADGKGVWTPLETIPRLNKKSVPKTGAALAYGVGSIFLLKGNNTPEFWQYTRSKEKVAFVEPATYLSITNEKTIQPNFSIILPSNPTKGIVNIYYNLPTKEIPHLSVYNSVGKAVYSAKSDNGMFTINNLPNGIYFVRFDSKDYKVNRKLIIIE